jgi:hypothetical protein
MRSPSITTFLVQGLVVSTLGGGLDGVQVMASGADLSTATTNREGTFALELSPSLTPYTFTFVKRGFGVVQRMVGALAMYGVFAAAASAHGLLTSAILISLHFP